MFYLPFATAQLRSFFDCGRVVRCVLPLGFGRFMHLVDLYGYQGADNGIEQLALTEQLFDAAFGELSAVARGQPCLMVGISTWSPPKSLAWQKGVRQGSGLTWNLLGFMLAVNSLSLPVSVPGALLVVTIGTLVGCTLATAAVTSCMVEQDRWTVPHLAVRTYF